jgi:GH25 family lysozyme M1 (1,4-beta-N-acetylmuramidase)
MRYSIRDPFIDQETGDVPATPASPPPGDAPSPPDTPGTPEPAAPAAPAPVVAVEPLADDTDVAPVEPAEPSPLWTTADDHVLHVPPQMLDRALVRRRKWPWTWAGQRRWQQPNYFPGRYPPFYRRSAPPYQSAAPLYGSAAPLYQPAAPAYRTAASRFRPRRRAMIDAIGRMVRAARRVGTWRNRTGGSALPVFRSQTRGRPFRIVTKPRAGLRHEILSIEPEIGDTEFGEVGGMPAPSTSGAVAPAVPVIFGIDEASVDGNKKADWVRARDQGEIRFAIIRSNYGTWEDTAFKRDWPKIKAAGLVRGPYLFLRYGTGKGFDPVAQAKALIKTVGPLGPGDLPPTLDVEFPGGRAKTGLTVKQCMAATRAAWKVLKDYYGVAPIIYTSARVWHEDLHDAPASDLIESPLWVTRYLPRTPAKAPFARDAKFFAKGRFDPRVPTPWGDRTNWWIHQYQGDARGFPGFLQVDMNRFNTMSSGASGDRVKWVQRRLGVPESGTFDTATALALRALKQKVGLPASDVVDPRTFAFLCWLNPAGRSDSQGEFGEGEFGEGEFAEGEFDELEDEWYLEPQYEEEMRVAGASAPVKARILWPALGFPAVVKPAAQPSSSPGVGDATGCICALIVSDRPNLSASDAARYLRYVPWTRRETRHIDAKAFAANEVVVRRNAGTGRKDNFGEHISFGANAQNQNGIVALLAAKVRDFYTNLGLPYLYEIRVSEAATARLQDDQYHLFWNDQKPGEAAISDELRLLIDRYAKPRVYNTPEWSEGDHDYVLKEYQIEYGSMHPPYNRQTGTTATRSDILHPLFIDRRIGPAVSIGHVTDTHVDVRADVYDFNLAAAKRKGEIKNERGQTIGRDEGVYNNFNNSFKNVYEKARKESDILMLTGDLIDYGRGHWGLNRAGRLQANELYHPDRNWFLFYYLIASGDAYSRPAYTILGNHDWRLNPYPPFSPGAPKPNELLHDHGALPRKTQEAIIHAAHGLGSKRGYSYTTDAENIWQLLLRETRSAINAFGKLVKQSKSLDVKGYPTETNIDSIAWYLFSINPFLDYAFTLPGRQSMLMLDWAKTEDVLFDDVVKGEKWGYDPFDPSSAAGTPRPSSCLSALQQRLLSDFNAGPSKAKIIGVHAPPISPYSDWYQEDLFKGHKTYTNRLRARGPSGGHPLFATRPRGAWYGMTAERGSITKGRDEFIKAVRNPKFSIRLVLSGHVHRNGIYVVHPPDQRIFEYRPKDLQRHPELTNALLIRGQSPNLVRGALPPAVTVTPHGKQGPLFITTTSAGPRGSFEDRPLIGKEEKDRGKTTDPGWARLELATDGTIKSVAFKALAPDKAQKKIERSAPQHELAVGSW